MSITTAMTTLSITGAITNAAGQHSVNLTISETATDVAAINTIAVASGDNTISVPSSTLGTVSGCLIIPAGISAGASLTIRTVGGDTGMPLAVNNPTLFCFNANAAPTSLVFHASASGGELEINFF